MLGFKLAQIEILKLKLDEEKRLEQERANLIVELEAALSPEMARQVEDIVDRTRGSFMMPARAASLPKPAHIDAAEAEATCGLVHEVRQRSLRALPPYVPCCGAQRLDSSMIYIADIWQGPARPDAAAAAISSDESAAAQVRPCMPSRSALCRVVCCTCAQVRSESSLGDLNQVTIRLSDSASFVSVAPS
jgi:hypothetical protein